MSALQKHFFNLVIFAFCSSIFFSSCKDTSREDELAAEIDQLKFEIQAQKKLWKEVSILDDEIQALKRLLGKSSVGEPAVTSLTFETNKGELDDPFFGNKDARTIVIAFSDYQCKPCRKFATSVFPLLKNEITEMNTVKFILRDWPLDHHPFAGKAAQFAQCAGEQGRYWQAHDLLFSEPELTDRGSFEKLSKKLTIEDAQRFAKCLNSDRYTKEIELDAQDGKSLNPNGAPFFLIGNIIKPHTIKGVLIRGAQPFQVIKKELLKQVSEVNL